jgi:hypothetical protein
MAMFHKELNRGKHKRKSSRHKSYQQWYLYDEYEDFEDYEPLPRKGVKEGAYRADNNDYLARDPKRDSRKQSPRRFKGSIEKSDYTTKW